jgi:hypothetical protein
MSHRREERVDPQLAIGDGLHGRDGPAGGSFRNLAEIVRGVEMPPREFPPDRDLQPDRGATVRLHRGGNHRQEREVPDAFAP